MATKRNRNKGSAPTKDMATLAAEAEAAAAKPPPPKDPIEEAEDILHMLAGLDWGLERELEDAKGRHAMAAAELQHIAGKAKRMISGHCRTAEEMKQVLDETWPESLIRPLLAKALGGPPWRTGATDQQIADALWKAYKGICKWPKYVDADFGDSYNQKAGNTNRLRVTVGLNAGRYGDKPILELKGAHVIAAARRLLKIPQPAKAPPPAKPATPTAAKKPAPKKTTPADLNGPQPKASAKPAPAGVAFRKQTFGQWMATARGALGVPKLDEADPRYKAAYDAGERPADAARRIRAEDSNREPATPPKPIDVELPLPVVQYIQSLKPENLSAYARLKWRAHAQGDLTAGASFDAPVFPDLKLVDKFAVEDGLEELAKELGREWRVLAATSKVERRANATAAAVDHPEPEPLKQRASVPVPIGDVLPGVTAKDLREAYSYETLSTGRVRRVFVDAARDCWVVMGMHLESDTFSLMPCVPIDRYPGPTESWHARRKHKLTPGQKPRFEGVTFAEQAEPFGGKERIYVFTDEENQVNVIAKPAAAANGTASRKAGAA